MLIIIWLNMTISPAQRALYRATFCTTWPWDWTAYPQNSCPPGTWKCDLIWESGLCRYHSLSQGHTGLSYRTQDSMTGVFSGERRESYRHRDRADIGNRACGRGSRDGRDASASQTTPTTPSTQKLGRGQETFLPRAFRSRMAPQTLISDLEIP